MSDEAQSDYSLEEQIRLIKLYQADGFSHSLTCGVDAMRHPDLVPQIEDGRVVLVCTQEGCSYKQTDIPPVALNKTRLEANLELRKKMYPNRT
ncbi:hypothetical protein KBA73_00955 [Patescibacteria group bacterium]|nr:hypothetical protein [Patescibacteria group bacterium]